MIGYDLLLLAFTTGMVVTVNPCGFAMLPAYLSFFVGAEAAETPLPIRDAVRRALVVGSAMTAGFVATFAVVGLTVSRLSDAAYTITPWMSVVIGLALTVFGIALLAGLQPMVRLPHLDRGGRTTGVVSMVLFGVSYAVASVGCTLPLFVGTMSTVFGRSLGQGIQYFVAYALGFGLIITTLTITLAVGERSLVGHVRRVLPFVHRIAGGMLVLTGSYIAYYGSVEVRTGQGRGIVHSPIINQVTTWSSQASTWILEQGGERVGAALGIVIVGALAVAFATRSPRASAETKQTVSERSSDPPD